MTQEELQCTINELCDCGVRELGVGCLAMGGVRDVHRREEKGVEAIGRGRTGEGEVGTANIIRDSTPDSTYQAS